MKTDLIRNIPFKPLGAEQPITRAADASGEEGGTEKYRATVSSETNDVILLMYHDQTDRLITVEQVLLHGAENVDMSRLEGGAPILYNHDRNDYIGVTTSARLVDRKLEVEFEFSNREFAQEKKDDIDRKILSSTSIGARILDYELQEIDRDGESVWQMRVTRWEPLEASVVTMPADTSVGITKGIEPNEDLARQIKRIIADNMGSLTTKQKKEPHVTLPNENPADRDVKITGNHPPSAEQLEAARKAAVANERQRMDDLNAAADLVATLPFQKRKAMVDEAMRNEETPSAFVKRLMDEVGKTDLENAETPSKIDMPKRDLAEYSFTNLMRGILSGKHEGIEFEAARAIIDKRGGQQNTRGDNPCFPVPWDVLIDRNKHLAMSSMLSREVTTGNASELVGTLHKASSFIETLRDRSVIMRAGATVLPGLVGAVDIPQQENNAVYAWVDEGADGNTTDLTFETKELRIKTASGGVGFTRRMQQQGTPNIEPLIYSDLITGAALLIDKAAIAGTGANGQPTGILNTDGINAVTWTAADGITWDKVVEFQTKLAEDHALMNSPTWLLTPSFYQIMQTKSKDAGSGLFLMSENGQLAGYPVLRKADDLGSNILFADFSQLILGFWEFLELGLDTATKAASGGKIVRAWIDMDTVVRHAVSFCKGSQA